MSNQPTPITDDEIRSVLYRMAAHVSFFAEPRTPDPKAAAFADALLNAVRPTDPATPPAAPERVVAMFTDSDYIALFRHVHDLRNLVSDDNSLLGEKCRDAVDSISKALLKRTIATQP